MPLALARPSAVVTTGPRGAGPPREGRGEGPQWASGLPGLCCSTMQRLRALLVLGTKEPVASFLLQGREGPGGSGDCH